MPYKSLYLVNTPQLCARSFQHMRNFFSRYESYIWRKSSRINCKLHVLLQPLSRKSKTIFPRLNIYMMALGMFVNSLLYALLIIRIASQSHTYGMQAFVDGSSLVPRGCDKCKEMDHTNGEIMSSLFKS